MERINHKYTYVLNNPLKYTDPSGYNYEWDPNSIKNPDDDGVVGNPDWGLFSFSDGGGYHDRMQNLHQNPDEWIYDHSTGTYRNKRTGERIDPRSDEAARLVNNFIDDLDLEQVSVNDVILAMDIVHHNISNPGFKMSVEAHYGQLWLVGTNTSNGNISSFGDVNSSNYGNYGEAAVNGFSFSSTTGAPDQDYSGFGGKAKFFVTGGNVDGFQYNANGKAIGFSPIMGCPPLPGYAKGVKVLQTGGHILKSGTLRGLNISKQQGKYAIENMKKANGLRNDFHGKILSNGDVLDDAGNLLDNLLDYLR